MTDTLRPDRRHTKQIERVSRIHARMADAGNDIPVRLWDGTRLGPEHAGYRLVLHHPWSLRALLIPGTDLAVGEAYLADAFDVEGSMVPAIRDVATLTDVEMGLVTRVGIAADVLRLPKPPKDVDASGRWRPRGRTHSKDRDADAVRFHYDIGNDFYATFLDRRMVYSCAYFRPEDDKDPTSAGDEALEIAQQRKLDLVCRKLGLRQGDRLLDVGCGWGALVIHAARTYGVRALGITLSEAQAALARERVAAAGLDDRVEIAVRDYREVGGTFEAIASIGMVEHVGADMLGTYFRVLADHLVAGGRLLNHGITTGLRTEVRDLATAEHSFAGTYVFPDGALAPSAVTLAEAERAGLEVVDLEQLRRHYARTLQHWVHRLERAHDDAVAAASETAYRVWRAYMAGSVVGFETRDLGVAQLLCVKDGRLPFGRDWMLPRTPA